MVALVCFLLALFASPFKSKSRLEAENAALAESHTEGFSIRPHRQHMHGGYKYDFAIIIPDE
jgi:hypothetical protein